MNKSGPCKNCGASTEWILHRKIANSGAESFCWLCSRCNAYNPSKVGPLWIEKDKVYSHLTEKEIIELPVLMPFDFAERCAVCGCRGVEKHHWAPRAIFGANECEQWPKDYLCKKCHDRWHKLVTPQLIKEQYE